MTTNLYDPQMGILAKQLDEIEEIRKKASQRYWMITNETYSTETGEVYGGLGLPEDSPMALAQKELIDEFEKIEKTTILQLQKSVRRHPLGPWVKAQKGIGEKQAARLLAAIKDPYWNDLHQRPRTVSELWAYSGYSVVNGGSQRRAKGQKANWSNDARMRAYLISCSVIKQMDAPLRKVYDDARLKYEFATVGGEPISAGQQHNRALRAVSKEILKGLWIEAKRIHESA